MTDLETSKALALAIGWKTWQIANFRDCWVWAASSWRLFDYRDWAVIGPIAAKYNKFPYAHKNKLGLLNGQWVVWPNTVADTPQKAIALAVINGANK